MKTNTLETLGSLLESSDEDDSSSQQIADD